MSTAPIPSDSATDGVDSRGCVPFSDGVDGIAVAIGVPYAWVESDVDTSIRHTAAIERWSSLSTTCSTLKDGKKPRVFDKGSGQDGNGQHNSAIAKYPEQARKHPIQASIWRHDINNANCSFFCCLLISPPHHPPILSTFQRIRQF